MTSAECVMASNLAAGCVEFELCGCDTADTDLHCMTCLAPAVQHSRSALERFFVSVWPDEDKHRIAVAAGLPYHQSDTGINIVVAVPPRRATFDEAAAEFCQFLAQANLPTDVDWVFREDVRQIGKRVYIYRGRRHDGQLSKDLFAWAFQVGLGASFEVLGSTRQTTFAFVDVPRDSTDADTVL